MCPLMYNACLCEAKEERFWAQNDHEGSRRQYNINNFVIINHLLFRPRRYRCAPEQAVRTCQFLLGVIEALRVDGELPTAWIGYHAEMQYRLSCALFGCGKKEEGYEMLNRALDGLENWCAIPDETPLDLGHPNAFGDVKGVKGKTLFLFPDGSLHHERMDKGFYTVSIAMSMTAPNGWEWFDSVREEPRFLACLARAREIEHKS